MNLPFEKMIIMDNRKKIAFITGASSGIGAATARLLADKNFDLILCGRRKSNLENLANELSPKAKTHLLCFDVREVEAVSAAVENLPEEWKKIDVLINNAGNAHGLNPIQTGNLYDWEAMIDINLKGLLYVTRAVLPLMLERQRGHILNIGSIAGIDAYENGNVYCASKAAVDMLSKTMRIDLHRNNIKVSEVKPGMVETEFSLVRFKGDAERAEKVYAGYTPLSAEDVADLIAFIVTRPPHVNIADTLILPSAQAKSGMVHKVLN